MTSHDQALSVDGVIFDIDTFAVHDGPGIRMSVYMKGCPLACAWCHSPESQSIKPELILVRERCIACGACVRVCPQGVHRIEPDGRHLLDRDLCTVCGACVAVCPTGALSIKGYTVSARSIIDRAARMKPFFDGSGGGITLTGGEVTMQPEFAAAILAGCRALGIHTAIETCGACNWSTLQGLLEYTDLVLYDLKLVDDVAHRRWTGNSNQRILDNVARLTGHNVQVRVPLIPGITDTEGNLSAIYDIMRQAGLSAVALLPYNPSAAAKYEWFDRAYQIEGEPQNDDLLAHLAGMGCALGLDVTIG